MNTKHISKIHRKSKTKKRTPNKRVPKYHGTITITSHYTVAACVIEMGNNWPDIVAEPGWGSASEVSYWGDLYRRALRADLQRAFSGATLPNIPEWDGSNFHHETNPDGAWGILTTSSDLSITFTGNIKEMVDATNGSTFLERLGWALEYHNFYFTPSGNTRTLNEFLSPYPECGGGQDGQSVTSTTNIVTTISFGH